MKSRDKQLTNKLLVLTILLIVMLQIASCNSAANTTPATTVPQPTRPPLEPTAKPELNGEQILQDSIAAVNEVDAYKISLITGGDFGEGSVDCNFLRDDNQFLCQHNTVLASGERDQSLFYQSAKNSWYKEDSLETSWVFISEGFKVGYSGINDYALIKQIIETKETIIESEPVIHIQYHFEPEQFLNLMLSNPAAVPDYISQANQITIVGNSYIDPKTKLPIQENIAVAIKSNITPLHLTYELSYDFIAPIEIEKPVGEELLEMGTQFFTAIANGEYDTAFSYFAALAKEELTVDDLTMLVETNKELFVNFQQMRLLQYDDSPEISNLDGEFILMLVEAEYTDGSAQQFRLLFIKENPNWMLGRFDVVITTNS